MKTNESHAPRKMGAFDRSMAPISGFAVTTRGMREVGVWGEVRSGGRGERVGWSA